MSVWPLSSGHKHEHRAVIHLPCFFGHAWTCPTARELMSSDGSTLLLIDVTSNYSSAAAFFRVSLSFSISLEGVLYVHMDEEQMSSHICVKMSYF